MRYMINITEIVSDSGSGTKSFNGRLRPSTQILSKSLKLGDKTPALNWQSPSNVNLPVCYKILHSISQL